MLRTKAVLPAFSAAAHGKSAGYRTGHGVLTRVCGVSSLPQVLLFPTPRPLPAPAVDGGWVCGYAHGSRRKVASTLEELDSITLLTQGLSLGPGACQLGYAGGQRASGTCLSPPPQHWGGKCGPLA